MLVYPLVEMPIGFSNVTSFTARTFKVINNLRFQKKGNSVFVANKAACDKVREPKFDVDIFKIADC